MGASASGRVFLAAASLAACAACVLPEAINGQQDAGSAQPDQTPVVLATDPTSRTVFAEQGGADGGCQIALNVRVLDTAQVPLAARVFVNDGNPAAPAQNTQFGPSTQLPVPVGGSIDIPLEVANQLDPELEQVPDPGIVIPLGPLVAEGYLVPPGQGENFVQVLVSDGFGNGQDPLTASDPVAGKSVVDSFWLIDTSQCDPWEGVVAP